MEENWRRAVENMFGDEWCGRNPCLSLNDYDDRKHSEESKTREYLSKPSCNSGDGKSHFSGAPQGKSGVTLP